MVACARAMMSRTRAMIACARAMMSRTRAMVACARAMMSRTRAMVACARAMMSRTRRDGRMCTGDGVSDTADDRMCTRDGVSDTADDRMCTGDDVSDTADDRMCTGDDVSDTADDRMCTGDGVSDTRGAPKYGQNGRAGRFPSVLRPGVPLVSPPRPAKRRPPGTTGWARPPRSVALPDESEGNDDRRAARSGAIELRATPSVPTCLRQSPPRRLVTQPRRARLA